jgi:uncharacterized protein YfaS (alpha-2-macroglobulin family)
VVTRTYEAVDDPGDVTQDADGTWRIRVGATVRVRLTMVAESQRTHVALVDPLPAGVEILNPDLANSPAVPEDPAEGDVIEGGGVDDATAAERAADSTADVAIRCGGGPAGACPWYPVWFDHQVVRDDRAEAFASWMNGGVYDYTYVARATTPGTFVVPPARAEEMYAPETFGRSGSDSVVVA